MPLTTVLLAFFPDGRPVSPRWRPLGWLGWTATGLFVVGSLPVAPPVLAAVGGAAWTAANLDGLAALAVRWRRSDGVARQQVKYLLLAALLVLLSTRAPTCCPTTCSRSPTSPSPCC